MSAVTLLLAGAAAFAPQLQPALREHACVLRRVTLHGAAPRCSAAVAMRLPLPVAMALPSSLAFTFARPRGLVPFFFVALLAIAAMVLRDQDPEDDATQPAPASEPLPEPPQLRPPVAVTPRAAANTNLWTEQASPARCTPLVAHATARRGAPCLSTSGVCFPGTETPPPVSAGS